MNPAGINHDIYIEHFIQGGASFESWLRKYLATGVSYPFVVGGPLDPDLDGLLRELARESKGNEYEVLSAGVRQNLLEAAEHFDLDGLKQLSHAIAFAGMISLAQTAAAAIDAVLVKLSSSRWSNEERIAAFLAVDQLLASISTFTLLGDKASLQLSERLLRDRDLSPFAATLFTSVAISRISSWPRTFELMVSQAQIHSSLFDKKPDKKLAVPSLGLTASHFDVLNTLEDFFVQSVLHSQTFAEILTACNRAPRKSAVAAIQLLESEGRIRRTADDDEKDLIYFAACVDLVSSNLVSPEACGALVDPIGATNWPNSKQEIVRRKRNFEEHVIAAFSIQHSSMKLGVETHD